MNNLAIRVEGLSKQYKIGGRQEKYRTLRDAVADTITAPFKRAGQLLRGQAYGAAGLRETIWALKDVSFEVQHGEVVGIIGRNGAGKSTLLKILSRITEPTEGSIDLYGRVGALLEVGTGFHPELTGRENIYLNGAILGMSRAEIDRKFDEIVDFAGVEKFIDTPVKHYSSGMGLRLGFAVAAHLEPEILIVDEVLAVGDAEFQRKCLGKMSQVAGAGRTVLFVSHNMAAVENLCQRVFILENGQLVHSGPTSDMITTYLAEIDTLKHVSLLDRQDRTGDGRVRFVNVKMLDKAQDSVSMISSGADVTFAVSIQSELERLDKVIVTMSVLDAHEQPLFRCRSDILDSGFTRLPGDGQFLLTIPRLPLMPGIYYANLVCMVNGILADHIKSAFSFQVTDGDFFGTGKLPPTQGGSFLVDFAWKYKPNPQGNGIKGVVCSPGSSD